MSGRQAGRKKERIEGVCARLGSRLSSRFSSESGTGSDSAALALARNFDSDANALQTGHCARHTTLAKRKRNTADLIGEVLIVEVLIVEVLIVEVLIVEVLVPSGAKGRVLLVAWERGLRGSRLLGDKVHAGAERTNELRVHLSNSYEPLTSTGYVSALL